MKAFAVTVDVTQVYRLVVRADDEESAEKAALSRARANDLPAPMDAAYEAVCVEEEEES